MRPLLPDSDSDTTFLSWMRRSSPQTRVIKQFKFPLGDHRRHREDAINLPYTIYVAGSSVTLPVLYISPPPNSHSATSEGLLSLGINFLMAHPTQQGIGEAGV